MRTQEDASSAFAGLDAALYGDAGAPITQAVFIDSRTPDIADLIAGLKPGEEAFLIDPGSDGLAQIAATLAANHLSGLSAIDIVGHGAAGAVTLGSTTLDEASLASNAADLAAIGSALAPGGDLALYSCDTAAGAVGREFIDDLSRYIGGADVLAATHLVGSADGGGSFTLDASARGAPTAPAPFTSEAMADYQGELASPPTAQLWFVTGGASESSFTTIQHENNVNGTLGAGSNDTTVYQGPGGLELNSQTIALATAAGKYFVGEDNGQGANEILEEPIGSAPSFGGSNEVFSDSTNDAAAISNLVVDAPDNTVYFAVNNTFNELVFGGPNFTGPANDTVLSTFPSPVVAGNDMTVDLADHTAYFTEVSASFSFTHTQVTSNQIYAIANVKPGAAANSLTASPLPLPGGYSQTINGVGDNFNVDDGLVNAVAVDTANDTLYIVTDFAGSTSAFKEGVYAYTLSGPDAGQITPVWTQSANNPSIVGNLNHIAIDSATGEYYISVDDTQVVNGQFVYESRIVIGQLGSNATPVTFQSLPGNSTGGPYPGGLAVDSDPTLGVVGTSSEALQGGAAVALLAAKPTATDSGGMLAGATIVVANARAGDELSVPGVSGATGTLDGGAIDVTGNGSSTLTLSGAATTAEYRTLLGEVTYQDAGVDNSSGQHPTRTIDWTVNDGLLTSAVATTTVTIDRPPVLTNETIGISTNVGGTTNSTASQGVLASGQASDPDGDTLTVTQFSSSQGIATTGNALMGNDGELTLNADGSFSYQLTGGSSPTDSFSYTVSDGEGGTAVGTLTFVAPAIASGAAVTAIDGNSGKTTGVVTTADTVTIAVGFSEVVNVTGNPVLALNDGGSATYASGSGSTTLDFTYQPSSGQNAQPLASTVLSGGTIENSAGVAAVVTNAAATFSGLTVDTTPATLSTTGTSSDAVQGGSALTLLSADSITGDNGPAPVASATITIANAQAGDELSIAGISGGTVDGGAISVGGNDTSTLTLTGSASVAEYQTLLAEVTYQDAGTDTTTVGHPTRTVDWTVNDGVFNSNTTMTTVTIDRPPVLTNETIGVATNVGGTTTSTASQGVLASGQASNPDGGPLTVTQISSAQGTASPGTALAGNDGALTLNADGSFSYQLTGESSPTDSFFYMVGYGNGGTAVGTLTFVAPAIASGAAVTAIDNNSNETTGVVTTTDTVTIAVGFSEIVDVTGNPVLALNDGGSATYASGSGSTTLDFTYQPSSGQNAQPLASTGLSGGTIENSAGVAAIVSNAVATFAGLTVDTTPATLSTTGTSSDAVQGGAALTLLSADSITGDNGPTPVASATITIANAQAGDELSIQGLSGGTVDGGAITVTGNDGSTLTLTGAASVAEYQTLLGAVTYQDAGTDTTTVGHPTRTVDWTVNDGALNSNTTTTTVTIDRPPTIMAGATATFDGGQSQPVALDPGLMVTDLDGSTLDSAEVSIGPGFASGDTLNFTNLGGITGSYDQNTGVLSFTGADTQADYQSELESVTYSFSPSDGDPTGGGADTSRTIDWSVDDGVASSGFATSTLDVVHVPPTLTTGGTVTYDQGGTAATLDSTLSLSDPDSGGLLQSATVQITSGYFSGDTLSTDTTGLPALTTQYDDSTHTLTISGSDTLADYQETLRLVTFSSSNPNAIDGGADTSRTITWSIDDGVSSNPTVETSTVDVACYVRGTRILTERGEIAVESLAIGERVLTLSGEAEPIAWIGHRSLDATRHPDPRAVWPVQVRAGAFGENRPARDLWLSPWHNIAVEGALMPIVALQNGLTVVQREVASVEYWHVELDRHDIIFAEGLPAESYLDTGNRTAFVDGGAFIEAHPDLLPRHWADTCAPLVHSGPRIERARALLRERLPALGYSLTRDADLHLLVDGERIEPIPLGAMRYAFAAPAGGRDIRLRSRTFVPAHTLPDTSDTRSLGLFIGRLQIDGEELTLNGDTLDDRAWHALEGNSEADHRRWTRGDAPLPANSRLVVIDLAGRGHYWRERQRDAAALSA